MPFFDGRLRDATRRPPRPNRVRTAAALGPGRIRNTWPARPPVQPGPSSFQKILPSTSSGQPPTGLFYNIRPCLPGRSLSAEILSLQTPPHTVSVGIPLTWPEATAPGSETPPGGAPAPSFLTPALSCIAPIVYSKSFHGHDTPSMGLLKKNRCK